MFLCVHQSVLQNEQQKALSERFRALCKKELQYIKQLA